MNRYTVYCTEEQTKKALELGAPIDLYSEEYNNSNRKDNEFYVSNDIVFSNDETICRNEEFDLVCIIGEKPNRKAYFVPTAEQMIGFIRSKGFRFKITEYEGLTFWKIVCEDLKMPSGEWFDCGTEDEPKEATLAAIYAALEHLTDNKK